MTLRVRLILISVLVLSLPLAGWQLVRSLERDLRESYQQTLIDTASAAARELAASGAPLPAPDGLYVHAAEHEFTVDGHDGEWQAWRESAVPLPKTGDDRHAVELIAAERRGRLYLLLDTRDPNLVLADSRLSAGDRVVLELSDGQRSGSVTIEPAAPGWLSAAGDGDWPRVQAALQPGERGWRMEIAVDEPRAVDSLGLRVIHVDDEGQRPPASSSGWSSRRNLTRSSTEQSRRLATLLPEETRGWVTTPDGWILASASRREAAGPAAPRGDDGWLVTAMAARLVGVAPGDSPAPDEAGSGRLRDRERGDRPRADWYLRPDDNGFVIRAAAPVMRDGDLAGHVVIERPAGEFMTRAYRSVLQLFVFGLGGMLTVALVLIGFAGLLSNRIRRLRNATDAAVGPDGRVHASVPPPGGSDEIADLGRSLAGMIERQRHHQDYLRTLAGKLSHELRTPLAMIRSSLDNLAEVDDAAAAERYRQRAEDGCDRLQRMFRAMSQAAHIEQGLAEEPLAPLDLGELVAAYAEGCRHTFEGHAFHAVVPAAGSARIAGSAELLAQLLDKLVDNATDFSPHNSRITLRVVPRGRWLSLQVDNPGEPIPDAIAERLFDSMVSERGGGQRGAHLGLGLHVARLIAERHGGSIRALNRPQGVRFQVDLPRLSGGGRRHHRW